MYVFFSTKKNDADFDSITSTNSDFFIKERRDHYIVNGPIMYTEYVISCLDCYTFQVWNLSIENIRLFDTVACRFTFSDQYNYGEEFEDDIFVGNNQFERENNVLTRNEREKLFKQSLNISDSFFRKPKHKSCFTSIQKQRFSYFCTECKNIYHKVFEKDLHVFYC